MFIKYSDCKIDGVYKDEEEVKEKKNKDYVDNPKKESDKDDKKKE